MTDRNDVPGVPADPNALRYDPAAENPRMDADPNALRYDPDAEPIVLDENTRINPTLVPKAGGVYSYDIQDPQPDHPPGNKELFDKAEAKKKAAAKKKQEEQDEKEAAAAAAERLRATQNTATRPYTAVDRGTVAPTPATEQDAEAQHQQELEEKRNASGPLQTQPQRGPASQGMGSGESLLRNVPGATGPTGVTGPTGTTGATGSARTRR